LSESVVVSSKLVCGCYSIIIWSELPALPKPVFLSELIVYSELSTDRPSELVAIWPELSELISLGRNQSSNKT